MKILSNILVLFRDEKPLPPQGELWRKLLHQISDIVSNFFCIYSIFTNGHLSAITIAPSRFKKLTYFGNVLGK